MGSKWGNLSQKELSLSINPDRSVGVTGWKNLEDMNIPQKFIPKNLFGVMLQEAMGNTEKPEEFGKNLKRFIYMNPEHEQYLINGLEELYKSKLFDGLQLQQNKTEWY